MNFAECVMACFDNREFLKNWERLRKKRIREGSTEEMRLFIKDVKELVWDRLPKK
jgi:hypothetical protein